LTTNKCSTFIALLIRKLSKNFYFHFFICIFPSTENYCCLIGNNASIKRPTAFANSYNIIHMIKAHDHDHDHSALSEIEIRVRALKTVLSEKGYIDPAALDEVIDTYQNKIGPRNGARVVAKSWVDIAYRQWLLEDATAAIASLGYSGRQGEHMVAVENTSSIHNMVVCTLCSCYPVTVLGLPPVWYKSAPYRSRAVKEPRSVLADFGVTINESSTIRVWDSTAEMRYLVIPQRPAGTEHLTEDELAAWVTRDSMIGTGLPTAPAVKS
jgi:nitrile hydratase